jgi:hypothetical protein
MSDNISTWSGKPEDFDSFYEWAGQANVMEGYTGEGKAKKHVLSIYDPATGWVEAPANSRVKRDALGYLTLAPERKEKAETEKQDDPAIDTKETKDSPAGPDSPVETKPAAEQTSAAKPAKVAATSK